MRALYSGAGLAVAAGLLMGAAMKPNLGGDDRPIGPQIFAGWSGIRSTGPFDQPDLAFAAYSASIPDYVIGTDWKRYAAPVAYEPVAEEPPLVVESEFDEPAYAAPYQVAWQEPPREPPSFPSLDGGRAYGPAQSAAAVPAQAAAAAIHIDEEAPPEATGDTTIN